MIEKPREVNDKIKVVISDLDGTLLNKQHKISEYTKTIFGNFIIKNI
jgi:hydroxymethylpyrimidine pyrophosphatase-like HAD family hydrolase